ncbi:MAG: homocysteine S-methyltransferase family protein [Thermoguttaceae bacterium]|nr:homocysteine S-methyltransferase family protein [Thermoguttaceae bacterium]
MNETLAKWLANGPLITDGGWGTQLQSRGLPVGEYPDLWNLSHPEKVEEVAAAYVVAGSDIILSNTFGSTCFPLKRHNMEDRVVEINRRGAEISRKAADAAKDRTVRVFSSMGPTGILLMMKQVSEEEMYEAFLVQANALKEGGADAIVVETMSDLKEAALAVRAAKTTGLPVVGCMTFDSGKNKDRTMMGATPEQEVEKLTEAGADAIGSNCGQGIDGFLPICKRLKAATDLPIWIKGNAGLPQVVDGKTTYSQTPSAFADTAVKLLDEGASFIGGCCGTTPDYIAELRKRIRP